MHTRLYYRVALVAGALLSSLASAAAESQTKSTRIDKRLEQRGYEWKRSGWTADAYLLRGTDQGKRWVYKRTKPKMERLMPEVTPAMRRFFRDMNVWVIDQLRAAPQFSAYRHLLPQTRASGHFGLLQELGTGQPLESLSPEVQVVATAHLAQVKAAARAALPGVEIDINTGNILFAADGRPTSFYDPAGGWWAKILTETTRDGTWQPDHKRGPFRLGHSVAMRVTGKSLKFGDAWLVVNTTAGKAYIVKHGFKMAYEAPYAPAGGKPLYELLGPPREEEREVTPGNYRQRFEHGELHWNAQDSTRIVLAPRP